MMSSTVAAGRWELDIGTGILNLCRRSRKMFGLPPHVAEPMREEEWVPRIHSDDLAVVRRALHASLVDGTIYAERFRAIRPDGSVREIFGVGRPVGDLAHRGRFVGWNVDVVSSAHLAGDWTCEGGHASHGTNLRGDGSDARSEPERLLERAEEIRRVRRARGRLLGQAMLGEPAFDLLLAMYVLSAKQEIVSLNSLAKAAGVPGTSAWRWLAYLVDKGFVTRCQSVTDRRAVSARLTDRGRAVFNEILAIR